MTKTKVLFICVHNSARSQMAEAFLNTLAGERFYAESAGFEPGILNPYVIEVMKEVGIDISNHYCPVIIKRESIGYNLELYSFCILVS